MSVELPWAMKSNSLLTLVACMNTIDTETDKEAASLARQHHWQGRAFNKQRTTLAGQIETEQ